MKLHHKFSFTLSAQILQVGMTIYLLVNRILYRSWIKTELILNCSDQSFCPSTNKVGLVIVLHSLWLNWGAQCD